jgi:hypothetical protein
MLGNKVGNKCYGVRIGRSRESRLFRLDHKHLSSP